MKRDQLPIDAIVELAERYGLRELAVFGSVVRGEDRPDSDIDFLYVRGKQSPRGLDFMQLQLDLEDLVGRKVDLVSKNDLHWVVRARVLDEAQVLYAA